MFFPPNEYLQGLLEKEKLKTLKKNNTIPVDKIELNEINSVFEEDEIQNEIENSEYPVEEACTIK